MPQFLRSITGRNETSEKSFSKSWRRKTALLRTTSEAIKKPALLRPILQKIVRYAEHIVRARGKRTAFTSVSLDQRSISRFGEIVWLLLRGMLDEDRHRLIEYSDVMEELRKVANGSDKRDRLLALRALRYAKMRSEGLISWNFDVSRVDRKDIIAWAGTRVQKYFRKT